MSVLISNFKACLVKTIEGLDPGRYQVFVGYETGAVLATLDSEVPVQALVGTRERVPGMRGKRGVSSIARYHHTTTRTRASRL